MCRFGVCVCASGHMYRPDDSLEESTLSFHHMGQEEPTLFASFGNNNFFYWAFSLDPENFDF